MLRSGQQCSTRPQDLEEYKRNVLLYNTTHIIMMMMIITIIIINKENKKNSSEPEGKVGSKKTAWTISM
jgi:hypothetical protein